MKSSTLLNLSDEDLDIIIKDLIDLAANLRILTPVQYILIKRNNIYYFGSIHQLLSKYSSEIVLLNKSKFQFPLKAFKIFRKYLSTIIKVYVDNNININNKYHILRFIDNKRLTVLTRIQKQYLLKEPPIIINICPLTIEQIIKEDQKDK
jgi:hypothetical protein